MCIRDRDKADWLPLAGRVVWLWPDADEAGAKAMQKVEKRLQESGATEVQRVNLGALAMVASDADGKPELTPGEPLAAGDDAADLIDRGWRAAHLALLIDAGTLLSGVTGKTPAAIEAAPVENDAATGKDHSPRRGFRLDERGVWFVDVKEGVQAAPRWISSPLDILASVRDEHSNGWGLWVGFEDPDGRPHREIIPARTFNGEGLEAYACLLYTSRCV